MKRTLLAAFALVTFTAAIAVVLPPRAAHADAPLLQGWWTATNPDTGPLGPPPVPVPAPGVPPFGLLAQGGASKPLAYAALSYDLGTDVTASKLTLTIAPNSGTTPAAELELCPLAE